MRRRHAIAAALACALLTILVGCGGTSKTGVSGAAGASLVRSGALAYVAVDSDLGSSQWQKVDDLLHKFPGRDNWLAQLRRELPDDVSYKDEIAPALGPEVDVAVFGGANAMDAVFVLMTKPESVDKARALVRKLASQEDEPPATRVVDGWFVVSRSNEMIDRALKSNSGDSLADDATFKEAVAELPTDTLAKAYVNGRQLADLFANYLNRGPQGTAAGDRAPFGLDELDWISAALEAKDEGIRFEADVKGAGGGDLTATAAPYASKLITGVPADALAFLTFRGGGTAAQLRKLRDNPMFGSGLGEFERQTGVRLDDVLELIEHEVALYVRRGPGLPEFSLALEAPQTQQALATLDRIAAQIAKLTHTPVRERSLSIGGTVTLEWTGFDGRVLLTTGPTGIADYRAGGDKLADDSEYKDALATAGAPAKTGGLIYLNLHDSLQLLQSYLGLAGGDVPAELRENLTPLQAFVAYSTREGDLTTLAAFLQIK
jgi:uncharacterized protein DUF3352